MGGERSVGLGILQERAVQVNDQELVEHAGQ